MSKAAKFPSTIWDGSSDSRKTGGVEPVLEVYREPDGADYQQLVAEVIAAETAVASNTTDLAREKLLSGSANTGALATTATTGFAYIPTCAGTPTGVPAATPTGFIPIIYDTTAHKLWFYDGGWKTSGAAS